MDRGRHDNSPKIMLLYITWNDEIKIHSH